MGRGRPVKRTIHTRFGKRAFDLCLSVPALLLASPLLLVLIVLVRLDSRGPVFYGQERVGRGGRRFTLWKLRSMVVGAERIGAGIHVERQDPRITRAGRFLRRSSLDELPQLWNIVRGDLSLVGPRAALKYQVDLYDERERGRLLVRPGLTGWAQVRGRRTIDWPARIALDLEYVERVSFVKDLEILLRTIPTVLGGEGMVSASDYWGERARRREMEARSKGSQGPPVGPY
jgi:lipopolysaccharide/colanic/teichoic acid biosynthesis glycosyltransferase